jgi:hypothetical protein
MQYRIEVSTKDTGQMFCYHMTPSYQQAMSLMDSYLNLNYITVKLMRV